VLELTYFLDIGYLKSNLETEFKKFTKGGFFRVDVAWIYIAYIEKKERESYERSRWLD